MLKIPNRVFLPTRPWRGGSDWIPFHGWSVKRGEGSWDARETYCSHLDCWIRRTCHRRTGSTLTFYWRSWRVSLLGSRRKRLLMPSATATPWQRRRLTDRPFVDLFKRTQRKRDSQYFSKRNGFWTWWLSILRMPFHADMLCKSRRFYEQIDKKWVGIHFLSLSKNDISSVVTIQVGNFCRLIALQIHPRHSRCVASWHFSCVWFVISPFPDSNSKVLLKLRMKLLTSV